MGSSHFGIVQTIRYSFPLPSPLPEGRGSKNQASPLGTFETIVERLRLAELIHHNLLFLIRLKVWSYDKVTIQSQKCQMKFEQLHIKRLFNL